MNQSINTDSKNSKEPQQKYRLGTVSIKIIALGPFGASCPLFFRNGQILGLSPIHKYYDEAKMRTRQKCVATDTWRSLGCRTTPLEHWSRREPTLESRWAKQQTKKLRPKPTKINSFMSGPSLSLTPDPPACN